MFITREIIRKYIVTLITTLVQFIMSKYQKTRDHLYSLHQTTLQLPFHPMSKMGRLSKTRLHTLHRNLNCLFFRH